MRPWWRSSGCRGWHARGELPVSAERTASRAEGCGRPPVEWPPATGRLLRPRNRTGSPGSRVQLSATGHGRARDRPRDPGPDRLARRASRVAGRLDLRRREGHLQATGYDDAGRKQYLYHEDWRKRRDREKFDRMIDSQARSSRCAPRSATTSASGAWSAIGSSPVRHPPARPRVLSDRRRGIPGRERDLRLDHLAPAAPGLQAWQRDVRLSRQGLAASRARNPRPDLDPDPEGAEAQPARLAIARLPGGKGVAADPGRRT